MVECFELKQKIEKLPSCISISNEGNSTLKVSHEDFKFNCYENIFHFSYIENRDFHLNNVTYLSRYKWLMTYKFNKSDIEMAKIVIRDFNNISILFENKILLNIVNKINGDKHNPLFVNKIGISFFNIEDTLDVFNLIKRLKT